MEHSSSPDLTVADPSSPSTHLLHGSAGPRNQKVDCGSAGCSRFWLTPRPQRLPHFRVTPQPRVYDGEGKSRMTAARLLILACGLAALVYGLVTGRQVLASDAGNGSDAGDFGRPSRKVPAPT